MATLEELDTQNLPGDEELDQEILSLTTQELQTRTKLLDNEIRIFRSELQRLSHENNVMLDKIKDNKEKIKNNRQLPYLVANVVEVMDMDEIEDKENNESTTQGGNVNLDNAAKGKAAVVKTSSRQTVFLPMVGLVDPTKLKPNDLVGVNKDSYLILEKLPSEFDSRVKAMEVDEKPTETYSDVGGLDKQIEELVEAIVLPMKRADKFKELGIRAPKGALMYGPPGTCLLYTSRCV